MKQRERFLAKLSAVCVLLLGTTVMNFAWAAKNCSSLTSQRPCFDQARRCPGPGHVTFCPGFSHVTFCPGPGHAAF
jgi:hypothetical protein